MPMYFGYKAHRDHGLGWNPLRSGRQMQQDPGYALRWHHLKTEAGSNAEIARLIDAAQRHGYGPREIVDAFEADLEGVVAEIRCRKAALDRSRR
jgi:hypothetical protein